MERNDVYTEEQTEKIKAEFTRLKGTCYLDHAGATLYSEKQLEKVFADLSGNVYANPHAHNTASQFTTDAIDVVRYRILSFFDTSPDEYSVIFTSGTTESLKVIAETFEFNGGSLFHLDDNHTSVLGMRNFAPVFREVTVADAFNVLSSESGSSHPTGNDDDEDEENCLFVYPAQSNFAGTKYPLSWIEAIRNGALTQFTKRRRKWYTLLDAACFVSTNRLDLHKYGPDFVALSFYKIFGYPTGLGALLVKRSSEHVLKKRYLGGGTVLMALSAENTMIPRPVLHERYEDGTISFLAITSLIHGFDTFKRLDLSPDLISRHTFNLAKYTCDHLARLRHSNGVAAVLLYTDPEAFNGMEKQGGIVNFNLKRSNGDYVGYAEVLHIANLHGIQLRTGCFCNPGACQQHLKLTAQEVKRHFKAGHICGDQVDLVDGCPTGSVRVSFGYMSTYEDADKFLELIENCFVTKSSANVKRFSARNIDDIVPINARKEVRSSLLKTFIYPVKSCGAFEVADTWKLTDIGLEYDRNWMIVNAAGSCVSQKQIKTLCILKPSLDLTNNLLILRLNDTEISVPLDLPEEAYAYNSKVCGDKVQGYDCGDKVAEWLCDNLERPGLRLLRQCEFSERISKKGNQTRLSLANQAQYLLINAASVRWLKDRIPPEDSNGQTVDSVISRFRANFVVDFREPFLENNLAVCFLNAIPLKFSGNCTRCQMICIDQETGEISKEPLQTLSRALKGKMRFGVYLSHEEGFVEDYVGKGCLVKAYFSDDNS